MPTEYCLRPQRPHRAAPMWTTLTINTALVAMGIFATTSCSGDGGPTAVATVASVSAEAGDHQVSTVGTVLADSLAVLVTNAGGDGVANVAVTWTPSSRSGTPNTHSVVTNANGIAKIAWTLGTSPGTDSMTAAVHGISSVFTATARVGAAAQLTVVSGNRVVEAAAASTLPPLIVAVTDQYGNPVPAVAVTWAVTAGGGSLASASTTTDAFGQATNTWTLGSVGSGTLNTVTASVTATDAGHTIGAVTFTTMAGYPPPQLVTEMPFTFQDAHSGWPILTSRIQGYLAPLLLDLGASANYISDSWLTNQGIAGTNLNIQIGTVTQSIVVYRQELGIVAGVAVGILGAPTLSHFDWVVDGPKDSVSLYAQPSQRGSQPTWLPSGVTLADCMPMQLDAYQKVFFPTQVNGVSVHSMFDSGSRTTDMNLAAATALGLDTLTSPNVHPAPFPYYLGSSSNPARWEVTGVTVTVGTHRLAVDSILIFNDLPRETSPSDAELDLGTGAFSDRKLFVSYSSGNVCIGQP